MISKDDLQDPDVLEAARACFAVASQLLYCEPAARDVALQALSGQFAEAPFAMDDPSVRRGLELLGDWCAQALRRAGDGDSGTAAMPVAGEEKAPDDACFAEADPGGLAARADVVAADPAFREEVAALQREWLRLFVGVGVPQASCFESFYVDPNGALLGANVLEVRRAYRRHGLQLERLHSEPDDHLGLMLGFLGHLAGLEARARRDGDGRLAEELAAEQDAFLSGHVLPWIAVWRYNVGKFATSDYYRGVGELAFGLCRRYAQRFGVHYDEGASAFSRARL